jgi:hypothetical protein
MPLKVIGAGFGRTGTMSLKLALEQLGFGPCYHMVEIFPKPEAPDLWVAAANGKPDWDTIFSGYQSAVDWPVAHFWRELMDYYPDAKIILSLRDAEKWFASTQATIFSPAMLGASALPPAFGEIIAKTAFADIGGDPHNHDACIAAFNAHNARVKAVVPASRLLVYEAAQGWAPLCAFLGVPIPDAPYPRENTTDTFVGKEVMNKAGL